MRVAFTLSVSRGIGKYGARAKSVVFALASNYYKTAFGTRSWFLYKNARLNQPENAYRGFSDLPQIVLSAELKQYY